MSNVNRPVTPSAAAHAARIRAGEERSAASGERDTRQTYEIYGERAAAQARADEELRHRAHMSELRARGVITADDEPEDDEEFEDQAEEYEEEELAEDDDEEEQPSTAERYAAIERKRQQAERAATLAAHKGAVTTLVPQGHRHAEQLVQPHRFADRWQKPAS
ncbi:hypothetical protein AB0C13_25405 [Streptomyces sp. NPDC049099]|uniref:hypothetical protein n=1 Tax=Streptomyces sp. NPDC049099 TaxID=3155768 RepID=UPI003439372C